LSCLFLKRYSFSSPRDWWCIQVGADPSTSSSRWKERLADPSLQSCAFWNQFIPDRIRQFSSLSDLHCVSMRIRIRHWFECGSGSRIQIRGSGFRSRVWTSQKQEKINIFWSTIEIYLFLGLHKGIPSYRRSLQP
jgi:hypothetical protein